MGGHLLSSVNPEAAEAIQPGPERRRLPDVGEIVRYQMRQGHGREGGRTIFPAFVQGHGERDTLMLTVVFDAGDMIDESLVSEIGPGNEFHCWERVSGEGVRPLAERLAEPAGLLGMVKTLETRLDELGDCVLGEFDIPKVSIIAIMQDFENRLRAVKAENEELREYLAPLKGLADRPAASAAPRDARKPAAAKPAGKRGRPAKAKAKK